MAETKQTYYLVVGLGSSGLSMARFLHSKGKKVVATDSDGPKPAAEKLLTDLGIQTQIGFHDQKTFDLASAIVVSPGVPLNMRFLEKAVEKGVPLLGDLDIFSQYNDTPIIAITGTNGKTTTTTLIRDMLEASGLSTFMGGNIGTPLVDYLMAGQKKDLIVAEISSFQLDLSNNFKPDVALLLNISEDHLDRYDGYNSYADSKWGIFKNQTSQDNAVINQAIDGFETRVSKIASQVFSFSSRPGSKTIQEGAQIFSDKITLLTQDGVHHINTRPLTQLPGTHNRENIAAAALATLLSGGNMEGVLQALENFRNLPHRMAFVQKINGVDFYDDSKATNTDAVIRALESFTENIILILGGREKNTDFSQLILHIKKGVKQIIALGEARNHIQETLGGICPVLQVDSMETAVEKAYGLACNKDVVLLSPACASFDMYENYGARGNDFIARVKGLTHGK